MAIVAGGQAGRWNGVRGDFVGAPPESSRTQVLIRRLIRQAVVNPSLTSAPPRDSTGQEIILDLEIDGVRCLLLRTNPPAPPKTALSAREEEIARMIAKGYPNKTIAAVLDISPWTVGTHLRRIFAKLGVQSRAAMVGRLSEEGLLGSQMEALDPAKGSRGPRPVSRLALDLHGTHESRQSFAESAADERRASRALHETPGGIALRTRRR